MEDAGAIRHNSQLLSSAFQAGGKERKLGELQRSLGILTNILQLGVKFT